MSKSHGEGTRGNLTLPCSDIVRVIPQGRRGLAGLSAGLCSRSLTTLMLPALVRETCGVHRPSLTGESETEVVSLSAPQRILLVRVCSCAEHEERLVFRELGAPWTATLTLGRQPVVLSSDSALAGVGRANLAERHVLRRACGGPSGRSPAGRLGTALRNVREAGWAGLSKAAVQKPSGEFRHPDGGQCEPTPGTGHLRDGQDLWRHPWAACPSAGL